MQPSNDLSPGGDVEQPTSLKVQESEEVPPVVGQIEGFIRSLVGLLGPEPTRKGRGAPRVLPAMCLWSGLLVCVLRGFGSITELWRLLSVNGLWSYPRFEITDTAVRERLTKGGKELRWLFEQVTEVLQMRLRPYEEEDLAPGFAAVVAADQTSLDKVARKLAEWRGKVAEMGAVLPGKLACLFDLRRQQWLKVEHIANPMQNEKVLAKKLVENLARGTLILADLGYFSFEWFDWLTARGYFWISRMREGTSYVTLHENYRSGDVVDQVIQLGKYRADRAAHAVRLVEFPVGQKRFRYITNVLDPRRLPIGEIARLYARRWDIEMAFQFVKRELKLHLIWSAKTEIVLQQVWAVLIIAQILQALRLEIAGRARVEVFAVSLPLLVRTLPRFAERGEDPVQAIVERGRFAKIIREPRRVKIQVPQVREEDLVPLPEGIMLTRKPRHARRKCGSRPSSRRKASAVDDGKGN